METELEGDTQGPDRPLEGDRVRAVSELPGCFQPVYSQAFRYFNTVQSEAFPHAYGADYNLVIAAPTGSGKTGVLELAVLRLVSANITEDGDYVHKPGCLKAVYLAPSRALVQERVEDWQSKFKTHLGLHVLEVTGDTDITDPAELDAADIICTTPEKFDSLTRGGETRGYTRFFSEVALVLIDEVHLLNEERGSALEAGCVGRIKMVSGLREMKSTAIASVRFIAASATIPNAGDVAAWLGAPSQGRLNFGQEVRPVPLHTVVRGYAPTKTDFLFERRLDDYLPGVIQDFSAGQPALVFCSSRKGTVDTAAKLAEASLQRGGAGAYISSRQQQQQLEAAALAAKHKQLAQVLRAGVGFHYAGMEQEDRSRIEQLFLDRSLRVLCTTSTLATGVNLPARLVVLKGTRRWCTPTGEAAGYREYERSSCLQMIGRAGRPQFDTQGTAIIMTQAANVGRYQSLVYGAEVLESQLKGQLAEYLNAEVVLLTIGSVPAAAEWLKGTFLYIRMKANPTHYSLPASMRGSDALDTVLIDRVLMPSVSTLQSHGLVATDDEDIRLRPTIPGQLMSLHYISLKTMIALLATPPHASMPDLLMLLASSQEFSGIKLRRGEKRVLNTINRSAGQGRIRFCVTDGGAAGRRKERITSGPEKIFLLLNDALSDQPSEEVEYSMKQEVAQASYLLAIRVGARIVACMIKLYAHKVMLAATANAVLLAKCLRQHMWDRSRLQCRQLACINRPTAERLASAGILTLEELQTTDARRIEALAKRNYPFGNQVMEELKCIMPPAVTLELTATGWLPDSRLSFQLTMKRDEGASLANASSPARFIVGSIHDDCLLVCEHLTIETFSSPYVLSLATKTGARGLEDVTIVASLIHERLIGLDTTNKLTVRVKSLPSTQARAAKRAATASIVAKAVPSSAPQISSVPTSRSTQAQIRQSKEPEPMADIGDQNRAARGAAREDTARRNEAEQIDDLVSSEDSGPSECKAVAQKPHQVQSDGSLPGGGREQASRAAAHSAPKPSNDGQRMSSLADIRKEFGYQQPCEKSMAHNGRGVLPSQVWAGIGKENRPPTGVAKEKSFRPTGMTPKLNASNGTHRRASPNLSLPAGSPASTSVSAFGEFRCSTPGSVKRHAGSDGTPDKGPTPKEPKMDRTLQLVHEKARKLMESASKGTSAKLLPSPCPPRLSSTAFGHFSGSRVTSAPLTPSPLPHGSQRVGSPGDLNSNSLPAQNQQPPTRFLAGSIPTSAASTSTDFAAGGVSGKTALETLLEENSQDVLDAEPETLGAKGGFWSRQEDFGGATASQIPRAKMDWQAYQRPTLGDLSQTAEDALLEAGVKGSQGEQWPEPAVRKAAVSRNYQQWQGPASKGESLWYGLPETGSSWIAAKRQGIARGAGIGPAWRQDSNLGAAEEEADLATGLWSPTSEAQQPAFQPFGRATSFSRLQQPPQLHGLGATAAVAKAARLEASQSPGTRIVDSQSELRCGAVEGSYGGRNLDSHSCVKEGIQQQASAEHEGKEGGPTGESSAARQAPGLGEERRLEEFESVFSFL